MAVPISIPPPVKFDPFDLKPGLRIVDTVAKGEDKTVGGLGHPCVSIWLPVGLSQSAVDQNLRPATKAKYDEYMARGVKPDAIGNLAHKRGSTVTVQNQDSAFLYISAG